MHKTTNPEAIFGRLALLGIRRITLGKSIILSAKEFMAGFDVGEATDDEDRSVEYELDKKSDKAFHFFENDLFVLSVKLFLGKFIPDF